MRILVQLCVGILTLLSLAACSDLDAEFDSLLVSAEQSLQDGELEMAQEYLELAREARPQRSEIVEVQSQIRRAEDDKNLQNEIESKFQIVCIDLNAALLPQDDSAALEAAWEQVASGFRDLAILDESFALAYSDSRKMFSTDRSEWRPAFSRLLKVCPD